MSQGPCGYPGRVPQLTIISTPFCYIRMAPSRHSMVTIINHTITLYRLAECVLVSVINNGSDSSRRLDRRSFAQALVTSGFAVGLAGCSSSSQEGDLSSQSEGGGGSGVSSDGQSSDGNDGGTAQINVDTIAPDELLGNGPMENSASPAESVKLYSQTIRVRAVNTAQRRPQCGIRQAGIETSLFVMCQQLQRVYYAGPS